MKIYLLSLGAALIACAPKPAVSPSHTLRAYVTAIEQNRPDVAYALLCSQTKKHTSLDDFSRRWRGLTPELQLQRRKLTGALATAPPTRTATLNPASGSQLQLVEENGRWKLHGGLPFVDDNQTPLAAINAFVRAVEERNYRAVLRLLSPSVARALETDINGRVSRLKQSLKDSTINIRNNRASIGYGSGKRVQLVRDADGAWRIEDFD